MEDIFITISGTSHYYGASQLGIGAVVKLTKDTGNMFDSDAIAVSLPGLGTVGYVANREHTMVQGTASASELCEKINDEVYCRIMFKADKFIIGKILM